MKRARHIAIILSIFIISLVDTGISFAQSDSIIFGPKQYDKPKGSPVTYTDTFQAYTGSNYTLWVQSGQDGLNEVKNVSVSINGTEVLDSSDLRKSNPSTKAISLQSNNTLKVVLKGKGGNFITVKVLAQPPSIAITYPQDGAILNSSPITVTGNVTNNAEVKVNGIQASISSNTFSTSVSLSEGQNTITATAVDQYNQTASTSINVTLIAKGTITGTVTDSTGLPLSSATVALTDSSNITQTALTASNGTYTIAGISSGTFSLSVTKNGYTTYSFTDTITQGQTIIINATLSPIPPVISNISISNITTDSATITWTTDQPSSTFIEYGTTTSYGSSMIDSTLTTSHGITLPNLTSATTYHFKVTLTNSYGFSSSSGDNTFTTASLPSSITLTITSPSNGETINKPNVMVKGTITNTTGNETGVTVNGIIASVSGSAFIANNVPLQEGSNTITVTAKDTANNSTTASVTVNAVTTGSYVKLSSNIESGIAPLTANFSASASNFTPASYQMDYEGDGVVDYTGTTFENISHTYTTEGIFYPTLTITDNQGNTYSDTIAITVMNKTEIDTLLKGKWEGMKGKLKNQDTEGALGYFVERSKERYRQVFEALKYQMPVIIETFIEFNITDVYENAAEYEIVANENGVLYSYPGMLIKDENGIWKFKDF